jgi:hypothetical protein
MAYYAKTFILYCTPVRKRAERDPMKTVTVPSTYLTSDELRQIAATKFEEAADACLMGRHDSTSFCRRRRARCGAFGIAAPEIEGRLS